MYKNALFCLTIFAISTNIAAEVIPMPSEVPLGMAYDGKIIWVADAKTRILSGYDPEEKKKYNAKVLQMAGVRDLAPWYPYLVTVLPNYIYVIDPINGNLVEKIQLQKIEDPTSVATDGNFAFVYNRADKRIYRINLREKSVFGSFPLGIENVRGMTFYKDFLWIVSKDQRVHKVSQKDGEVLSFIPLPENTYGVSFINGGLHISRPNQIESVDFIETDNFVAASKRDLNIQAAFTIKPQWPPAQRLKEPKMTMKFSISPLNAHQRLSGVRVEPRTKLGRTDTGEYTVEHEFPTGPPSSDPKFTLQGKITLYNITYILNNKTIREYFDKPVIPEEIRIHLEAPVSEITENQRITQMQKEWKSQNEGKHPFTVMPFLLNKGVNKVKEQKLFFQLSGIPAREALFYHTQKKQTQILLQIFLAPAGWVTFSPAYSAQKPKEFPLDNNFIEIYFPDTLRVYPLPKNEKGSLLSIESENAVRWDKIEVFP